jgi:hypothetical protein
MSTIPARVRRAAPQRFEAQHRADYPFDGTVILLDLVVEILCLAKSDIGLLPERYSSRWPPCLPRSDRW